MTLSPFSDKIIEKIVEVPRIEIVEREKIVEVPRIEYVEKIVQVDRPVYLERPPQPVVREVVEINNDSERRELNHLQDEYRKLQIIQEDTMRQLETFRYQAISHENVLRNVDTDRTAVFNQDRH